MSSSLYRITAPHCTESRAPHCTESRAPHCTESQHLTVQNHEHLTVQNHEHFTVQNHEHLTVQNHEHLTAQNHEHLTVQNHCTYRLPPCCPLTSSSSEWVVDFSSPSLRVQSRPRARLRWMTGWLGVVDTAPLPCPRRRTGRAQTGNSRPRTPPTRRRDTGRAGRGASSPGALRRQERKSH